MTPSESIEETEPERTVEVLEEPRERHSPPIDQGEWLLEEYRQLSQHYFHEDNYYLKANAFFSALDTALLAVYSTRPDDLPVPQLEWGLPMVGFIASLVWLLTLIRIKYLREKHLERLDQLEFHVRQVVRDSGEEFVLGPSPSIPKGDSDSILFRVPATYVIQAIPVTFIAIWLYLFEISLIEATLGY